MSEPAFDDRAKLARMARQIADFFRAYPEEQAAHAVADHINQFWTPRMRADYLGGPAQDDPLLARVAPLIRSGGARAPK